MVSAVLEEGQYNKAICTGSSIQSIEILGAVEQPSIIMMDQPKLQPVLRIGCMAKFVSIVIVTK